MALDFGAMAKLPTALEMMLALGFADGSAHLRFATGPDLFRLVMRKKPPAAPASPI